MGLSIVVVLRANRLPTRLANTEVTAFFDEPTNTVNYVVRDPASTSCAVIDSVMDIDYAAGRITYASANAVIDFIKAQGLTLEWLIETRVHADHLSGAPYIQGKLTVTEPYFDGLTRLFREGIPAIGIFADKGGQFLGGYGMNAENRQKTLAALNDLWQGNPIRGTRTKEGESIALFGRRLAIRLMAQVVRGANVHG